MDFYGLVNQESNALIVSTETVQANLYLARLIINYKTHKNFFT